MAKGNVVSKIWDKITWLLWSLCVIALPFSTLPLVMRLTGSSSVAPGSLLFLIPLVIFMLPVLIKHHLPLPFHVKLVLLFFLFALLTISLAFLRQVPDYKDQSILSAGLEGVVTLGVGLLFYLVSVFMPRSHEKIEKTLRLLNWTGLILVLWSILQVTLEPIYPAGKPVLNEIQKFFSPTRLIENRMLGFASEPSWLAHMLNLVFLAYWLGATYSGTSAHRWRFWKFSFENLLLGLGVIVLVGTLSRGGLLAFLIVFSLIFIMLNIRLIRWLVRKTSGTRRHILTAGVTFTLVLLYLGLIIAGLWGLSKVDPRMENVFQFSRSETNPLLKYADELQFGERVIYWQTGWNIFNDHPISGVGVGFSGFYFPQSLPDSGWGLSEVRQLLYRSEGLLNIKNLWVRLLAETGIIGFSLFLTFLALFGVMAIDMIHNGKGLRKALGFTGIFMLAALIAEEFSVDSFALPYLWFTLGLVTAAWRWYTPSDANILANH